MDASFQEATGISLSLETETIKEGGQNRFTHQVPGRTNYDNLVLKRGLMVHSSELSDWCTKTLTGNLTERIEPRTIMVSLLNAQTKKEKGKPPPKVEALMTWKFVNAYPVKWEVAGFDATKSDIMVESLTFAYSYFDRQDAPGAKNYLK